MSRFAPHAEATYRVVLKDDATYTVEVTIPEISPATVSGFGTEEAAERWITNHKENVAKRGKPAPFRSRR